MTRALERNEGPHWKIRIIWTEPKYGNCFVRHMKALIEKRERVLGEFQKGNFLQHVLEPPEIIREKRDELERRVIG